MTRLTLAIALALIAAALLWPDPQPPAGMSAADAACARDLDCLLAWAEAVKAESGEGRP